MSYFESSGLKFISWKGNSDKEDENGNGMILFSSIGDVHPKIDLKYVFFLFSEAPTLIPGITDMLKGW